MNELSAGWKVFRIVCIVQLILIAFQLIMSVAGIFYRNNLSYQIIEFACYILIFWFLYLGLTLLNDNYPDVPLSQNQKRKFNWLFLINFLLIAFLFAQVVSTWKILKRYRETMGPGIIAYFKMDPFLIMHVLKFLLHFIFLTGMYQLRRTIYSNTISNWQKQFDEKSTSSHN